MRSDKPTKPTKVSPTESGGCRHEANALTFLPNHIHEFRKDARRLFIVTVTTEEVGQMVEQLIDERIAYRVQRVSPAKINLFFGLPPFVDMARILVNKPLSRLTRAEDFILGTLRFLAFRGQSRLQPEKAA